MEYWWFYPSSPVSERAYRLKVPRLSAFVLLVRVHIDKDKYAVSGKPGPVLVSYLTKILLLPTISALSQTCSVLLLTYSQLHSHKEDAHGRLTVRRNVPCLLEMHQFVTRVTLKPKCIHVIASASQNSSLHNRN